MGPTQSPPPAEPYSTAVGPEEEAGVGGLTPEFIEQMVALGTLSEQDAEALRQKIRFEGMQGQANPGGIHTQAGFVSDSPLQGLAGIMREYRGRKGAAGAQTEREGIMEKQERARMAAGQAIGNAMRSPTTAPQTPSDFNLPGGPTPMAGPLPAPEEAAPSAPVQPPKPPMQGDPYGGPGGIPNSPDGWMAMLSMMRDGGVK